jgi:hypothetical protein
MSERLGEIKLIPRIEILETKWNALLETSDNAIFMSLWYLDAVMENWQAFVLGDYELVFPISISKKMTFNYSLQPLFLRAFSVLGTDKKNELEFLKYIFSKLDFYQLTLTSDYLELAEKLDCNTKSSVYQLVELKEEYYQVFKKYSENTKRKLKDFKKSNAAFTEITDVRVLIDLFRKEKGEQFQHLTDETYYRLEQLMLNALENKAGIIEAISFENEIVAIGFFIQKGKDLLYLKGIVTEKGKKIGAMQALFDKVVQDYTLNCNCLDFGGSSDAGLASFNKKFGATDKNYLILKQNNVKWPLNKLVNRKLGM